MKGHGFSRLSVRARLKAIALVSVAVFAISVQGAWAAPPVNDDYDNATPINSLPFGDNVDLTTATNEPGEPTVCYQGAKSAWFTFTPSADEQITVSHTDSSFGGAVGVFVVTGPGLAGLSALACADPFNRTTTFQVTSGVTYALQASDATRNFGSPALGTLTLSVAVFQPPPPPANDDLSNAAPITSLPFDGSSDLTYATAELGEPFAVPQANCLTSSKTVWYTFTAPRNEAIALDATSTPGLGVTVWREDGAGLVGLTGIACGSSTVVGLTAGMTYAIQLVDLFGGLGIGHLHVNAVPPPSNDNFASATPVTGPFPFDGSSDNSSASIEAGEPTPSCSPTPIARTVWWSYTPTQDIFLNTAGGGDVEAIYTGKTLGALTEVACVTGNRAIFWKARAGRTYWFQFSVDPTELLRGVVSMFVADDTGIGPSFTWTDTPSTIGPTTFFENPDQAGETSEHWDFGDGTTGSGTNPSHRFKADGTYTVTLKTHTTDGRTDVVSNDVAVVTHDIAVVSVTAPKQIRVGQTVMISARIVSRYYDEPNVTVFASEITTNGAFQFTAVTQDVLLGASGTTFSFPFTATAGDLAQKHVTFQVEAHLPSERDSRPADNLVESKPATTIVRA